MKKCQAFSVEDGCDAIQYDTKFNQNVFSLTSTVEWKENDPRVKREEKNKC